LPRQAERVPSGATAGAGASRDRWIDIRDRRSAYDSSRKTALRSSGKRAWFPVRVSTLTFLDVGLELRSPLPYLTWDLARKKSPGTLGRCRPGSNLRGSTTIRKPAATLRLCLAQKGAQIGRNLQYAPMMGCSEAFQFRGHLDDYRFDVSLG
jgi:hypothetical protein